MLKKLTLLVIAIVLLSGCSPAPTVAFTITPTDTITSQPTANQTPTQTQTPTPTATSVPLITSADSPLQGIGIEELYLITSNSYNFRYPFIEASGNNYNHTGLDLAFFKFKEFDSVLGHPIQAVLPGKVVESLDNRWPYGNMIMIETPLDALSLDYLAQIPLPTPYAESEIQSRSNCQPDQTRIPWSQTEKSIYIVYAHLQTPSIFKAGDTVLGGQVIGAVGSSGNAVVGAEHLHLEVRIGPSVAKFGVISDYMPTSTNEERYNYCIWALSEVFQPIDPSLLWKNPGEAGQ